MRWLQPFCNALSTSPPYDFGVSENDRLCPRCGAYWGCDCPREELMLPADEACEHDWADAVGVELDEVIELGPGEHVVVCRLCGTYAVWSPR